MNNIMSFLPVVTERENNVERTYDPYSRLLKDRIIFCHGPIETAMADTIVAQLLFLEAQNPDAEITMYVNSPGGEVMAGLAITSTMNFISCDVRTVCMGMAASMGAFITSQGTPGKRAALADTQIMIHEVSSGAEGKVNDIKISYEHSMKLNKKLMTKMAASTNGKTSVEEMSTLCERDRWLEPEEALEMGLIDNIYTSREEM